MVDGTEGNRLRQFDGRKAWVAVREQGKYCSLISLCGRYYYYCPFLSCWDAYSLRALLGSLSSSYCTCIVFTASTCTFEEILSIYIHYNDLLLVFFCEMCDDAHFCGAWHLSLWITIGSTTLWVVDSVWSLNNCCSVVCSKAERDNWSSTLSDVNRWYVMSSRHHPKLSSPVSGVISGATKLMYSCFDGGAD